MLPFGVRWAAASLLITPAWTWNPSSATTFPTFNNNTVFQSPPNYTVPGTLYARTLQLPDGSLLATWENYSPEPPPVYFPIFKSPNQGQTWAEISRVQDIDPSRGLRYQPFLYLLPAPFAGLPKNTVLLAGNSIPTDLSTTRLELYYSPDSGLTWHFLSPIASGGEAVPNNSLTPVWEPSLRLYDNQLICFYSDQRDPDYGQKLSHQVTTDLHTWSEPVNDVTYPVYTDRPGMPITAYIPPLNAYMLTYEYGGGPIPGVNTTANYSFPAYYKISSNPLDFGAATGLPVNTPDGTYPQSSPYVVWTPWPDCENGPWEEGSWGWQEWNGGKTEEKCNGTIVVSTGTHSEVFVNQMLGDVNGWRKFETQERISYTRSLRILDGTQGRGLMLAGGGLLPPSENNSVTVGVVDLKPL